MTNVSKYLLLLENLKFAAKVQFDKQVTTLQSTEDEPSRLEHNVGVIKKYLNMSVETAYKQLGQLLEVRLHHQLHISADNVECVYVIYLEYILLTIRANTNFNSDAKEDLISARHLNMCIEAIRDLNVYALQQHLHPFFYKTGVFPKGVAGNQTIATAPDYLILLVNVNFYAEILKTKQFLVANSVESVLRNYIAAIYSLFLANQLSEYALDVEYLERLQVHLHYAWSNLSKTEYFRNILLLKAMSNVPMEFQKRLHRDLLSKLTSDDGFASLVGTLQGAYKTMESSNDKHAFETIANIVAFRGLSKHFQQIMIRQIFKFINGGLLDERLLNSMGAGLLALRKLYDLSEENQVLIADVIAKKLSKLIQPEDVLAGLVVLESKEFTLLISWLYELFCTSCVECLPSKLLMKYLPLLLQMYYDVPEAYKEQKQKLSALTLRCLNNISPDQLPHVVKKLYALEFDADWQALHERIVIMPNADCTELSVKIAPHEYKQDFNFSLALPELLMSGNFNVLTYQVFMILLKHMCSILEHASTGDPEVLIALLQTDQELVTFLNSKYNVQVELLLTLNTLVSHAPLKTQISEHATEFLKFIHGVIERRITRTLTNIEATDQTLLIMLTIASEMLAQVQFTDEFRNFIPALQKLQQETANQLLQQRAASLVILLSGESKAPDVHDNTTFNLARSLIASQQSHLQVYGIQMLLDLLKRRDAYTVANAHIIMALALTTLNDKESYTFLNCVRLFVGLVDIMEAEVLELLSDEYLNERAIMDFRLVVGECILKVSKELGPLCYKYKEVLLNCFMHGARSPLDEFRLSAFANLAQLCRILTYEVHKFFQELLHLIECELSVGKYVPAQRAAVLVLRELLEGMNNLFDFEEMLLPIYRLLRSIAADEHSDEKMRTHAANGLQVLAEKCEKLLFQEQSIEKEIKVLGIKDKPPRSRRSHIVELN